ncbi:MAG TPA: Gmad2 immunoglobulin-like domain-containing protein, partial [Nocardioides sp.]|nr:Gmad2 immunoglobulin-like domain-containing protein [Nocardioides sp.]
EEQRLRDLLDDAVSDVEPRRGLDAITSRTKVSSMSTRPWLYGVAGAVVATAATIAAFAVLGDDTAPVSGPEPAASPSAVATKSATEEPTQDPSPTGEPQAQTVPVYYVGETGRGPRLFREFHQVRDDRDAATVAVTEAVAARPLDPDYGSPWSGTGVDAGSVSQEGGTITVDLVSDQGLRERPAGMSEAEASMAVEQVLYTVQGALQSRDPVQLLLNGERTDQLLGVPTAEPLAQGDETTTLAQVWIIDPQHGDTVESGAEVSGTGAFFEANVVWELRQGDQVVESGFTTAEECCTMAPYSFRLPDVPSGDYVLVVKDQDMSDGEGPPPFEDTKKITVR